jgi:F-box-like
MTQQTTNFANLPNVIKTEIFSYLNAKDLSNCRQVSKSWERCASPAHLWIKLNPELNINALQLKTSDNLPRKLYEKVRTADDCLRLDMPRCITKSVRLYYMAWFKSIIKHEEGRTALNDFYRDIENYKKANWNRHYPAEQ